MKLRLLGPAVAAAALLAAGAAMAAKAPPKQLELYAMDCGRLTMENADGYADDGSYKGRKASMIVPCYLIRHPKGDLIWDTGVPQAIYDMPDHTAPGGIVVTKKLTDQLSQLGLTPADIEYLSISHSHFDHIGNAGLFAGSTWIVDADERAHAFRPAARSAGAQFAAYSALENAKTVLIEGDATYDVFGDKSVSIIQTPGHTPGHTVLLVRLKSGLVLLTGDMWHIADSRAGRRVPRFNTSRDQTLKSMDLVEKIAADTKARVILEHVPEDFDSLPKFPQPLR